MVSNLQMQIQGTLRDKVPTANLGTLPCMCVYADTKIHIYVFMLWLVSVKWSIWLIKSELFI